MTEPIQDAVVVQPGESTGMGLLTLLQSAIEKGADADALEKLVNLKERIDDRDAAREFAEAFAEFQTKCPTIKHNKTVNTGKFSYTYADLDGVAKTVGPYLHPLGFSFKWDSTLSDGGVLHVICWLAHKNGHRESSSFACPTEDNARLSGAQHTKAALTFARRCSLLQVLGITDADSDDDAQPSGEDRRPPPDRRPPTERKTYGEKPPYGGGKKQTVGKLGGRAGLLGAIEHGHDPEIDPFCHRYPGGRHKGKTLAEVYLKGEPDYTDWCVREQDPMVLTRKKKPCGDYQQVMWQAHVWLVTRVDPGTAEIKPIEKCNFYWSDKGAPTSDKETARVIQNAAAEAREYRLQPGKTEGTHEYRPVAEEATTGMREPPPPAAEIADDIDWGDEPSAT